MTEIERDGVFFNRLEDVLDEHFPKGGQEDRGKALVLFAEANVIHNQRVRELLTDVEKAYGGCHTCFGKGYATTLEYTESSPDFGDETTSRKQLPLVRPCICERGKQIKELFKL